ncbi:hypothetical protein [Limnospira platensis]|uniref:hypothetical protein n=2 Tax=Limnospira platensis TaxID=118562 RepID=UPI003D6E484A
MKRQGILAPSGRGGMSTIMRSPTSRGGFTKLLRWWRTSQKHPLQAGAGLPNCCGGGAPPRNTPYKPGRVYQIAAVVAKRLAEPAPTFNPPLPRDIFTLSMGRR